MSCAVAHNDGTGKGAMTKRTAWRSVFLFGLAVSLLAACSPRTIPPSDAGRARGEPFFDDFDGPALDARWEMGRIQWGRGNGGVVPENVSLDRGTLRLEVHGDLYAGPVRGVRRDHGRRVGALIRTRDVYGSGRFEVRMKAAPVLGACSAVWTYHHQGRSGFLESAGLRSEVNHEIDIEIPGRPDLSVLRGVDFRYLLCTTWRTLGDYRSRPVRLPFAQDDGEFHTYRFDWHTGGNGHRKKVDFYVDDVLVCTTTRAVPDRAGTFTVGVWCPWKWAGEPAFDTARMVVDWVRVTPFREPGDR